MIKVPNILFALLFAISVVFMLFMVGFFLIPADIGPARLQEKDKCKCPPPAKNPLENVGIHICAFHLAKDDPNVIVETQHYCSPLGDESFQCLLYDSIYKHARLIGVEYVISDRQYQQLSTEEKQYWHPHEYEIREGLLLPIGMPKECEQKTMKALLHSWGKTIHTWRDPNTSLPIGAPRLMWSASKEHNVPEKLVQDRDKRFETDTKAVRKERQEYLEK